MAIPGMAGGRLLTVSPRENENVLLTLVPPQPLSPCVGSLHFQCCHVDVMP